MLAVFVLLSKKCLKESVSHLHDASSCAARISLGATAAAAESVCQKSRPGGQGGGVRISGQSDREIDSCLARARVRPAVTAHDRQHGRDVMMI
jgi:hypothetical protein